QLPGRPARYRASRPEAAIAPPTAVNRRWLEEDHSIAHHLAERLCAARSGQQTLDILEVLVGAEAHAEKLAALVDLAQDEIRTIDRPSMAPLTALVPAATGAGVRVRSIYEHTALDAPGTLTRILDQAAARDRRARLIARAPFQLRVADDRLAMVLLDGDARGPGEVPVIHPSPLLPGVAADFETLWRYAVPLEPDTPVSRRGPDCPTPEEAQLLAVMAAGMTDEAAARHMGLSLRTVQRQVRGLMNRLGAQTRFQAGLQAKNRGWL